MENNRSFHAMILTGEEANLSSFAVFALKKKTAKTLSQEPLKPSQICVILENVVLKTSTSTNPGFFC